MGYKISSVPTVSSSAVAVEHRDSSLRLCDDNSGSPLAFALSCPEVNSALLCQKCSLSNASSCLSCYPAALGITQLVYLKGSTCTNNCDSLYKYYVSGTTCELCVPPCVTCMSLAQCLTCVPSTPYLYENQSCGASCSYSSSGLASYTDSSSGVRRCLQCDSSCSACVTRYNCTYCSSSSLVANNGTCMFSCSDGYYNNSGQCSQCLPSCGNCSNGHTCITCINSSYSFISSTSQCVTTCPNQVSVNGVCQCATNCSTCAGSMSNCLTCTPGALLEGNSCVPLCTAPAYNDTLKCYACKLGCAACTSGGCTSCDLGFFFLSGGCYDNCAAALGAGYVNNPSSNPPSCAKCTAGCSSCDPSNTSNCSSCLANYTFNPLTRLCQTNGSTSTAICSDG